MEFRRGSDPTPMTEKHAIMVLTQVTEVRSDGLERKDDEVPNIQLGNPDLEEDVAGGLGRHLGLFSTTLLMFVHPFR